jgi:hypothetical protein
VSRLNSDVVRAVRVLNQAAKDVESTLKLPTEVGKRIRWDHNEVVWERVGPDAWRAVFDGVIDPNAHVRPYPARHVAAYPFEVLK